MDAGKALVIGVGRFAAPLAADEEPPTGAESWQPLDFVYEVLPSVERSLQRVGYRTETVLDPDVSAVREAAARITDERFRVVHAISHGATHTHGDPGRVDMLPSCTRIGVGTNVSEWASNAQALRLPTLFLVDLCGSGRVARLPYLTHVPDRSTFAWVIAASGADESAYDGRFTRTVADVLDELARTGLGTDATRRHVSFSVVARRIRERVETLPGLPQTVHATAMDLSLVEPELPFFPNPRYLEDPLREGRQRIEPPVRAFLDDLGGRDGALDADHFADRVGVHFSGRTAELRGLAPWLADRDASGLRVVTGSPGVGKSALLAALACAAHPELAAVAPHVRARLLSRDPACCPPALPDLAVVHARQRGLDELLHSMARQWELDTPAEGWDTPSLIRALSGLSHPPPFVLDALDEALDPDSLVANLLVPLANATRDDGRPVCRMLLAMRPWEQFDVLRDDAAAAGGLTDLDGTAVEDLREDVAGFLEDRLADLEDYRGDAKSEIRRAVALSAAARLTTSSARRRGWGAFIVAAVFARYLESVPSPASEAEAARLGASVPITLPAVLELDLSARSDGDALRAVLAATACAKGEGVPADLIARLVPEFLPGRGADLDEALRLIGAGRFYLRSAVERDGTTLYRLFHQGLADHLSAEDRPSAGAVFERLLGAPNGPTRSNWATAQPYLLRHAIEHAQDADRADELLTDGEFLVYAGVESLLPALDTARSAAARQAAVVYRASIGVHRRRGPTVRRQLLTVDAARYRADDLHRQLTTGTAPGSWRPQWATGFRLAESLRHTVVPGKGVQSVACSTVDGRPVVAAGGFGGVLRVWDLGTGEARHELSTHGDDLTALASVEVDGRPVVAAADRGGAVSVWDLSTGRLRAELPSTDNSWPQTIGCAVVKGTPMAVVGRRDGTLHIWDLAAARLRHAVPTGHARSANGVNSLAVTTRRGRPVAVTSSHDGLIAVWEIETGRHVKAWRLASGDRVGAVACMTFARIPIVVAGRWDGTIQALNLINGRGVGPLITAPGRVETVSCGSVGGVPVVIAGMQDGTVRMWEIATGRMLPEVLMGHDASVRSIAPAKIDGSPVAVSGSLDGTVRIWDLPTRRPPKDEPAPARRRVRAMACTKLDGRPTAVIADVDGTVRLWDLATGRPQDPPMLADTPAYSVACTMVGGRPAAVLGGLRDDPTVRVVDLPSGRLRYAPMAGHTSMVGPIAAVEDAPLAVSVALDGKALVWDLERGKLARELLGGHPSGLWTVACVTVNGRRVVIAGLESQGVRVWDLETGETLRGLIEIGEKQRFVDAWTDASGRPTALIADFGGAVSGDVDAKAQLWDLAARLPSGPRLSGHTRWVSSAAPLTVEGSTAIATGSHDGTVRLWDAEGGHLRTLTMPGVVTRVTAVGDGLLVKAGGELIMLERDEVLD